MSHKNKKGHFVISILICVMILTSCLQTPSTIVSPTQTTVIQATSTIEVFPTHTLQAETAHEDTGYEGYYKGIVVITEYFALLSNGLFEEAYDRLSISQQNKNSLTQFTQLNEATIENEIATIKPLVIWQIEEGISPVINDKEERVGFFVELFNSQWREYAVCLSLVKEEESWKIDNFSENYSDIMLESTTEPTLDIGSVPDRSYYDSIISIGQFHVLFNHKIYEDAYKLLSPSRRIPQSLEEFISDIETFGIIERQIVSIRPFYEGTLQLQTLTTPAPNIRRMFYTEIYAEGKGGWAGSIPNGNHGYYITTVLEDGVWKIYSVNTAGLP